MDAAAPQEGQKRVSLASAPEQTWQARIGRKS
jgi:hypothetical protein